MLVEDGRVVARSSDLISTDVAEKVDHGGKTLLPRFIDNHCHILPTGLDLRSLPLGKAETAEEVLDLVRDRHRSHPQGWLMAVHYDNNRYGRHIACNELDRISKDRPILLRHASGHAGVVNSAALSEAGVHESTPDPAGGTFVRDSSGALTGLLLEHALGHVSAVLPPLSENQMVEAILDAGRSMEGYRIAAASDMQTGRFDLLTELRAYRTASERGCPISTRLYVEWDKVFGPDAVSLHEIQEVLAAYPKERCRLAGIKIFADGAIGAATAAVYGGYEDKPLRQQEFAGTLIYPPDRLKNMVVQAASTGWQISVHSIGDRATDLVLDAFAATEDPARHRLEHAMLLSDRQIERIATIGCHVTFQPEFLMRFSRSYQRQLGPTRAAMLLRTRSVLDAGIKLSFSSDRPITAGDPWDGIVSASNRPQGFASEENCSPSEAFAAYTVAAAAANEDLDLMGTLLPGTRAEFQVLESS